MYQQQNACAKGHYRNYQKAMQLDTKTTPSFPLLAACQAKTGAINEAGVTLRAGRGRKPGGPGRSIRRSAIST